MSSEFFRGWPKTVPIFDGYRVETHHRSPWTVRVGDMIGMAAMAAAAIAFLIVGTKEENLFVGILAAILLGGPVGYAIRMALRVALRTNAMITFYPGTVTVGGRTFDATRIDGFDVLPHPKARDEEIKLNDKMRRKKMSLEDAMLERYYGLSNNVFLRHMGQPVLVACVFGNEKADMLAHRLNALFALVNDPREWASWDYDRDRLDRDD
jgi:hypothetical protein